MYVGWFPHLEEKYDHDQFNTNANLVPREEPFKARRGKDPLYATMSHFRRFPLWLTTSIQHDQLLKSYLALRSYAPIREPKEWFFFASYGNYEFWNITDQNIVSGLLENANLDPQSQTWDLVCMAESKRDQKYRVSNLTHILHTIYLTDDMQGHFFVGYELPGLCHPSDCQAAVEESESSEEGTKREKRYQPEHYKWNHRGGNLVFNRRKLEDTDLCQNLDKAWSDWVCHFATSSPLKLSTPWLITLSDRMTVSSSAVLTMTMT